MLKFESVASKLRERLLRGEYPVGSRFPSVVEIGREFQISTVTAFKSVRKLVDEQFVVCHANARGTVVVRGSAPRPATRATTLACLLRPMKPRNDMDNFGVDVIEGMRDAISNRGYRFVYHGFDEVDYEQRMVELAQEPWVAGILVDAYTPLSTLGRLAQVGKPMAMFNRQERINNVTCVTPDYERVGRDTARFLLEKGYRQLAFYGVDPAHNDMKPASSSPTELMCRGFFDGARAYGLAPEQMRRLPDRLPAGDAVPLESFGLPGARFDGMPPVGIMTSGDRRATQIIAGVGRTDLRLARDIGVTGCFDLECGRLSPIPPSTWTVDRHAVGREAVAELIARIEDPTLSRSVVKVTMEFLDRGTA